MAARGRDVSSAHSELTYEPALDGLRAVAILAVLVYHGGVLWAGGGFLGVEAFFVLSGFLITSLLVARWRSGAMALRDFWARRARRLLPALLVLVVVCLVYESLSSEIHQTPDFGADALATLGYIANWHQLWTASGYFAQSAVTSPLQHTWSLAIEEQFYIVWPLVLLGLLVAGRRLARASRLPELFLALVVSGLGAICSAVEMALLYDGSNGLNRVYYGTDTRAQGLLVGAFLAIAVTMAREHARHGDESGELSGSRPRRIYGVVGLAGALGMGLVFALARSSTPWLFKGGFLAFDLATLGVILGATAPAGSRSAVREILTLRPLRAIGIVSYGLYLWHFPLMAWLTDSSTGLSGVGLLWLRLAASGAAATISYFVIEQPVRRRRLKPLTLRLAGSSVLAAALVLSGLSWAPGAAAVGRPRLSPASKGAGSSCERWDYLHRRAVQLKVCPGYEVSVVGDSIGLTLAMEIGFSDPRFGMVLYDDAALGCGFIDGQPVDEIGTGYATTPCSHPLQGWVRDEKRQHADAVIVEMGYWDELQHEVGGKTVHIGERRYDEELYSKMVAFTTALSRSVKQVVLLSVPVVSPPSWPDGSPAPQSSPVRRRLVNSLLRRVARRFPGKVSYFNITGYLTRKGHYSSYLYGGICRSPDGIHFYTGEPQGKVLQTRCGARLESALLSYLRQRLAASPKLAGLRPTQASRTIT